MNISAGMALAPIGEAVVYTTGGSRRRRRTWKGKIARTAILGAWLVFWLLWLAPCARAFNHPGIPLSKSDLDYVKGQLTVQPWLSGWNTLQADPHASINYTMEGPFTTVSRVPNFNQNPWKDDMDAVYKLALRGYLAGDATYSAKATAIMEAWATTMTSYGGSEAYLDIGDYAAPMFGGAEILRGTYTGWTAQNTADCINYFNTAIRPAIYNIPSPVRGANQGTAMIKSVMGLAVFCDDTAYWNQALYAYRNDCGAGITDTAPMGMIGDSGRDQGHARGQFGHYAWAAAVAWAQGVDLFSEQDNRLAGCAEYFSRYNVYNVVPFVNFGGVYEMDTAIGSYARGFDLPYRNIIYTAYATRKGLNLPWTARESGIWGQDVGFEFLRLSDTSTATYSPLVALPAPALAISGAWTDADIGSPGQAGSSSFSNGVWTVKGGGADVYYPNPDQFHFAYQATSGDFTIVARALSQTAAGSFAKAGLMIRDSLSSTANFADVYMTPTAIECEVRGALGESHGDVIRTFTQAMPYWVKMERRGQWIARTYSQDGINWGGLNYAWTPMTGTVYVGLMACANDNTKLMTATMDNVAISAASGVAPAGPTSLVAAAGQGQVALSWIPGAGSAYGNVKRAAASGGPYTTIAANVPAATYVDMDLANGTAYYYVVSGTNAIGESANSAPAAGTPSAAAAVPAAPANLTVFAYDGSADLSWAAVPGAVSYNVKRATSSGGPYARLFYGQGRDATTFTDMDPVDGTTYYYVVDAVNAWGESANSNQGSGTPQQALVWTGATNGTWDVNTTSNWTLSGTAAVYQNGQPVQFDDTAFTTNPTAASTVTPSSVLINNSVTNYDFGSTVIGGAAKIVKRGTGALTLHATQSFTGGMTISDGCTINFYSGATLGTSLVNIDADCFFWATSNGGNWAGTLPSAFSIAQDATLTYRGDWKVAFNGNFTGTGTLDMEPGYHASFVILSGSNGAFGGMVIVGGSQPTLLNSANAGSANAIWDLTQSGNRLGANVTNGTFSLGELIGDVGSVYNNVTSANTATFVLGNNNTEDVPLFNGAIVDNGSGKIAITKTGSNTQILAGANTYSGLTTVGAGELDVATHSTGGGSYTVGAGILGVINPVDGTSLAMNSLNLGAGSELSFANVASSSIPVITATNVVLTGTCTVQLADSTYLTNGAVYPLIRYSGAFTGTISNFQVQMPAGWSGVLVNSANQISLSVTGPVPTTLNWSGATSGNWSDSTNWGGSTPQNNDPLVFGATSGTTSLVNDLGGLLAGAVTFNSGSKAYTLSGNSLSLKGDIINDSTATQTFLLPMVLLENINVTTNTGAVVLSGEIDKGIAGTWGITKLGTGTLTLSGANTFSGGVTLSAGILALAGTGTATSGPLGTGTLTLGGGTVQFATGAVIYNNIVVPTGANISLNEVTTGNSLSIYGNISGSGTITANSFVNYGGVNLNGDNSGFSGTLTLGGGNAARNRFGNPNAGSAAAKWVFYGVADSPSFGGFSGTLSLGELSGNSSQVRNDQTGTTVNLSIGALNTSSTWAGSFTNASSGIIALTKVGTGTLTVSGVNTYIGSTTINGGVLNVTGSLTGGGAVTVNSGATLAGSGSIAGATTVASGGTVAPGNAGAGTLTFNDAFQPAAGSILAVQVGTAASQVSIATTGTYTAPSSGTVTVNVTALSSIVPGTYPIISGVPSISATNFALGLVPADYACSLAASGSSLLLTVRIPGTSTWTGTTSGNWSVSTNWGGIAPTSGDNLSFTNSSSTSLVNDLSRFTARSLLFNSGSSSFSIGGNALALNGDITNNSTASQSLSLPLVLLRNSNVTTNTGAVALSGAISELGGSWGLTKLGAGTLTLSGSNTFSGGVTVSAGVLAIAGSGTTGYGPLGSGTLTLAGGALQHGSGAVIYNNVVAQSGTTSFINEVGSGNSLDIHGNISGSGNITTSAGVNYGGTRLFGDNSGFSGTFTFGGSSSARNKFSSATAGSANAKWVLNGVADSPSVTFGTGTLDLGELSGNSSNIRNDFNGTMTTFSVGALNTSSTWTGVFTATGGLALTKVGAGILTVSNTNPYTGPTTVNGGTLNITGALTGTGAVTVNNGGTLGGTGAVTGPTTVASGGILAPGNAGTLTTGTFSLSGSCALNAGAALSLGLGTHSDRLSLTGTYTGPGAGTVSVNITALAGFGTGTYTLMSGATGLSLANFVIGVAPIGYTCTLGAASGVLSLTVSAPAAPTSLAATGGDGQAALTWTPSTGATAYNVLRSTSSGSGYAPLTSGTTAIASFTDTTVTNGTTYYYVVSASNLSGTSANSAQAAATPLSAVQSWRLKYFGTINNTGIAADTADADSDGMTNAQEFAAGTNPTDPKSALKVSQMRVSGSDFIITFPSVSGKSYRVERSDTLFSSSWTIVQDNIAGTGNSIEITDTNGALQPRRFYHVVLLP